MLDRMELGSEAVMVTHVGAGGQTQALTTPATW